MSTYTARLEREKAAVELTGRGISMRDAAAILGISYQRVHQLLTEEGHSPLAIRATAG